MCRGTDGKWLWGWKCMRDKAATADLRMELAILDIQTHTYAYVYINYHQLLLYFLIYFWDSIPIDARSCHFSWQTNQRDTGSYREIGRNRRLMRSAWV
jgi:hypothetical protein